MDPSQSSGNIYCPQCETECSVGDKFCRSCATALPAEVPPVREEPTPPIAVQPGSGGHRFAALGVLIVLIAGAVAFYVLRDTGPGKLTEGDETSFTQWCQPIIDVSFSERLAAYNQRRSEPGYFERDSSVFRIFGADFGNPRPSQPSCEPWLSDIRQSIEGGWSKDCAITYWKQQLQVQYLYESPPDPYLCE